MPKVPKAPSEKPSAAAKRPRPAPALSFPRKVSVPSATPEAIAHRAYELFVEAGMQHGRDIEHWLVAEEELRSSIRREAAG